MRAEQFIGIRDSGKENCRTCAELKALSTAAEAVLPWLRVYADNVVDGDAYKRVTVEIGRLQDAVNATKKERS